MNAEIMSQNSKSNRKHIVTHNRELCPLVTSSTVIPSKKEAIVTKYPKYQTDILMKWMIEHKHDPCPSSSDIEHLKIITGLNGQQITNWTTNVRKRNVRATTKKGKKPHHFIDFFFLSYQHDRQQQLAEINDDSNEQQWTKTSSVSRRKPLIQNRNDASILLPLSQNTVVPDSVQVSSSLQVDYDMDRCNCSNVEDDSVSNWNIKDKNIELEMWKDTYISTDHEIGLLQHVNTFDVDVPCSGDTAMDIKSNIIPKQETIDMIQTINSHEYNNEKKAIPMINTYLGWNSIIDTRSSTNVANTNVSSFKLPMEKIMHDSHYPYGAIHDSKKGKMKKKYNTDLNRKTKHEPFANNPLYSQQQQSLPSGYDFVDHVPSTTSFDYFTSIMDDDEIEFSIDGTFHTTVAPV